MRSGADGAQLAEDGFAAGLKQRPGLAVTVEHVAFDGRQERFELGRVEAEQRDVLIERGGR